MSPIDLSRCEHLKATDALPSPKGAALAIIRQTQKEDCSFADLAKVARVDPAFVARLIRAANSMHVEGRRPIASIDDAIVVLGLPTIRSLALGFSLVSGYRDANPRGFDYPKFWSRSFVTGVAFRALTLRTCVMAADESFSVGLLAQMGRLALATLFPERYAELVARSDANDAPGLLELERQAFAMNHNELTAAMFGDWRLPQVVVDPVRYQEHPEGAGFAVGTREYTLLWSLIAAYLVTDICLADEPERQALLPRLSHLGSRLALDADTLGDVCAEVTSEWREWGGLVGAGAIPMPPLHDEHQAPAVPVLDGVPSAPASGAGSMRCLVVDDDPSMRAILKSLLTGAGHEVVEAENGRQGFDMALELEPQIMIVDWLMPEMDGLDLTRELRQTKVGRHVYILILTGLDEDDRLVQAFEAGVDDFMTKPLKPRLLAARLRAGMRMVRLQREIERDREEIRRFAAELAITNQRLQDAGLFDILTGLPNRRYAIDRLKQEWAGATRSRRPLACLAVDVDAFKSINAMHGHECGDFVLQQVAEVLKVELRAQDVVCRTGADEYLVICPDTPRDAALACAERLRAGVAAWRGEFGGSPVNTTASIGVAVRHEGMDTPEHLIRAAEQALLLAANKGGNAVCGD